MVAIEKPYFMENDGWWFTDEAGQARISPDAPMRAKKSYWKWIGSEPVPSEDGNRKKSLMYFEYEAWSMHPTAFVFERSGPDVLVEVSECMQREFYPGNLEDMEGLAGIIERHGLLKWPRASRRPEDIAICDGSSWTVKFVFADGVMHMRSGETYGEPEAFEGFMEELESLVSGVVFREG